MDLMVVVKRSRFEAENEGRPWKIGDILNWKNWTAKNPQLRDLSSRDRLWIVTARPDGQLWLVARYDNLRGFRSTQAGFHLRGDNGIAVSDITSLAPGLRFTNRKPIRMTARTLGNSLQTAGILTPEAVLALEQALGDLAGEALADVGAEPQALEGTIVKELGRRRTRDRQLRLARLHRDDYTCQGCKFSVSGIAVLESDAVLEVHHVDPLHDTGPILNTVESLVTLCPTCHRLIHALATSTHRTAGLHIGFLRAHLDGRSPANTQRR